MNEIEEITAGILGPRTSMSEATEGEIRSLGAILALHKHLLARGWEFESVDSLVIWVWPPSRIADDGDVVASTDIWVSIEKAGDGPEDIDVELSLVGEPDDGADSWVLRYPLMGSFDVLPLYEAEAYRFGARLPASWLHVE